MIKNDNYENELELWHQGLLSGDYVGILGWTDEHKKVSIHDCVLRLDLAPHAKSVQSQEEYAKKINRKGAV